MLDVVLAASAVIVLSPVLAAIAVVVRLSDGGPAIFRQQRVGRGGEPFKLLKFRSMPVNTATLPSHAAGTLRVTPFGRLLRRSNIDELPQLWNILRGEMSIVGPRPALPSQEALVALRRANGALRCRPGLTGLAQIRSYDGMPVPEKAHFDGEYAANVTLSADIAIIGRTFGYLMRPPPTY